jgi:hypothetical protein
MSPVSVNMMMLTSACIRHRVLEGEVGDTLEVPVEYDVRGWLKELAASTGIASSNELLSYMMLDIWRPQLVPVCASLCIASESPLFYALPVALPLPPLAKTNKMRLLW